MPELTQDDDLAEPDDRRRRLAAVVVLVIIGLVAVAAGAYGVIHQLTGH